MADVQPLRGLRYASESVGDLARVVTPPYDVISQEEQASYYARSPYNAIRLELGKEQAGDTALDNHYTRAAALLTEWYREGILKQDPISCYYLYQQVYAYQDRTYTRTSLMARVRLEPWSEQVILPHEHTMSKPLDDRLKLLRATTTNISPIMCLYDDTQGYVRALLSSYASDAEVQITDEIGDEHRLHPITDSELIKSIQIFFRERQLSIADGHHRYETALNYREEIVAQRKTLDPDDAANFVMMALTDMDDPGLVVLPTHRLLFNLDQEVLGRLTSQNLSRYFKVEEIGTIWASPATTVASKNLLTRLAQTSEQSSSIIVSTAQHIWLLTLNENGQARMAQSGHSDAWNQLEVALAQTLVIEDLLKLNAEDMVAGTHLRYTRDAEQALQLLASKEIQVAILLNATPVRQLRDVVMTNELMPAKSTYFYPKLLTGLVMNPVKKW